MKRGGKVGNPGKKYSLMSFRTERSVVKNLDDTHVDVSEILRFALDDNYETSKR